MDQAALAALQPLGIEPGRVFDPAAVTPIDGTRLVEIAAKVAEQEMELMNRPEGNPFVHNLFKPKGQMSLEAMVHQSVIGPIGFPAHQAVYPPIATSDDTAMNAQHDYVIRMGADELLPAAEKLSGDSAP